METKYLFEKKKPIIGMIHLPPLLSYPEFAGMQNILEKVLSDLRALEEGGVDAIALENELDHPHTIFINKAQVASFAVIAKEIVEAASVPIGIGVLRNDWEAALAIAKASGAKFVRLDVFVDRVEMGGNIVEVDPVKVLNYKKKIKAENILLLTDVHVKHSNLLDPKTLPESINNAIKNGSNGIIITGSATGSAPSITDLIGAKAVAGKIPVLIGSGLNKENAISLLQNADGAIVGTALKSGNNIDINKVEELIGVVRQFDGSNQ